MYMKKELDKSVLYTEKDVHNKTDSMLRKGEQFNMTYRNKVPWEQFEDQEIELDLEAAEVA